MNQFPNVNPLPFSNAQLPFGLLGRSFAPQLPAVGGYSDSDLEKMMLGLMQSGADPGMLQRVQQIRAMRQGAARAGAQEIQLLRPTPEKAGTLSRAATARQQLLDALATRPQ